jgi:hypothetical protein
VPSRKLWHAKDEKKPKTFRPRSGDSARDSRGPSGRLNPAKMYSFSPISLFLAWDFSCTFAYWTVWTVNCEQIVHRDLADPEIRVVLLFTVQTVHFLFSFLFRFLFNLALIFLGYLQCFVQGVLPWLAIFFRKAIKEV